MNIARREIDILKFETDVLKYNLDRIVEMYFAGGDWKDVLEIVKDENLALIREVKLK